MKEGYQLFVLILASLFIATISIHATNYFEYGGSLTIKNYTAYLSHERLRESYVYDVKGSYTMLYRVWDAPLIYNGSIDMPFIKINYVDCPYYWYVKDFYGDVFTNYKDNKIIDEKAYINEVGCYNPGGYSRGLHTINYSYEIYPPIQYDKFYHINIKFASEHVPYKNFEIVINDDNNTIYKIFPHPPMKIEKKASNYILTGKSQKNGLIEVEMLLKSISNQKFLYEKSHVEKITIEKNNAYYFHYAMAKYFATIMKILLFLFPLIMLLIYYLHGREKKFFVPEYLSFIPKKRKPWLVNLIFNGDATIFEKDGLYATLLDLHRRKIIEIEGSKENLRIKILSKKGLDNYERKIISFLERHSRNGIFDVNIFRQKINEMDDEWEIKKIKEEMDSIFKVEGANKFIINGRIIMAKYTMLAFVLFIASAILYFFYFDSYPPLFSAMSYSFFFFLQFAITIAAPSTLFGHWKKDYYKEKLQWDAFRRFLTDMAQIKKYGSKDISIWKEWLVYATALGVGKKVAKELKEINIEIPEREYIPYIYIYFSSINTAINTKYSKIVSSSSGGGGSGGGGGFGGGGAGGR